MTFFFDYLYIQGCDLYRRDKIGRANGSWRESGIMVVALSSSLTMGLINLLVFEFFFKPEIQHSKELVDEGFYYLKIIIFIIFIIFIILFGIRYKKYITYEQIVAKVRELNNMQKVILNILVGVYLFTALPLFIFVAWYFSL